MLGLVGLVAWLATALGYRRQSFESHDMCVVLESLPGFQVGDLDSPDRPFLPNGAPRSWADFEGRARVALAHSAARRAERWTRLEEGTEEVPEHDYIGSDELDADGGDAPDFDFDGGPDFDDRRWEAARAVLDPYWSTCPAVVEDAGVTNDMRRYVDNDGQRPLTYDEDDALRVNALERRAWQAAVETYRDMYRAGPAALARVALVVRGKHAASMVDGLRSLAEIEASNRVHSIGWVVPTDDDDTDDEDKPTKRDGMVRLTSAEERSYMQHGACARDHRWLQLVELFQRGEAYLAGGYAVGVAFLSWLSKCWAMDVERQVSETAAVRKARSDSGNKVLACGSEYYLTREQMKHLRARRTHILRRYSAVTGLDYYRGRSFIRAYALKFWRLTPEHPTSIGTRGGVDFGVNPVKSAGPRDQWPLTKEAMAHMVALRSTRVSAERSRRAKKGWATRRRRAGQRTVYAAGSMVELRQPLVTHLAK